MKSRSSQSPAGGRHPGLDEVRLDAVADLFAVLSEVSRLCILHALKKGPAHVGEIVRRTGLKQANVSRQLSALQSAGIVARRAEGNRAFYAIDMPLVFELCDLVCRGVARQADRRARALRMD